MISDDERKNTSKLPGLGDIPLIGRLFSNQQDQKSKTEIVLAITPRIVSNIARPSAEISEYWSGTDTVISDKPMINMPASSNGPMTSEESARERLRLRRENKSPTEQPSSEQQQPLETPEQPPQPEVTPTVNPDSTAIAPS